MKAVIMAGGRGTRIASVVSDVPKPLIKINDKPVLQYEIECLKKQGFTDIIITVSYMADKIQQYFKDGRDLGVNIDFYVENTPLGNAGALLKMWKDGTLLESEDFLLLNADSMFDVDFKRIVKYHSEKKAFVTLFTHPNSHPYDSGLIVADDDGYVDAWLTKEDDRPRWYKNRVNAGIHVINTRVFEDIVIDIDNIGKEQDGKIIKVDLDRQILKPLAGKRKMAAYDSPEYVKDMGTPERFKQVSRDLVLGRVAERNLEHKQKAIFIDRDGTINKYVGFLRNIEEFELLPNVAEAIRLINDSEYLAVVVTNQPVIARGEVTYSELEQIHNKMETLLGEHGAYIDALYFCPHHPDSGFDGEIPELKFECECRKPKPGMLIKAAEDFNISLSESWMVGDGKNDVLAGKMAGCMTAYIGVESDFGSDINVGSLFEFVEKVLKVAENGEKN